MLIVLVAAFLYVGGLTRLRNHFAEAAIARRDLPAAKAWLDVSEWLSPRDPRVFFLAAWIARREGECPRIWTAPSARALIPNASVVNISWNWQIIPNRMPWNRHSTLGWRASIASRHQRESLIDSLAIHTLPHFVLVLLLTALGSVAGCSRQTVRSLGEGDATDPSAPQENEPSAIEFADQTGSSNVNVVYRNGEEAKEKSIVESLGGGVAMLDYDRDGRQDLFFPTGGELPDGEPLPGFPNRLYRNLVDFQFVETSSPAGVANARTYSHGCAAADADGDGFTDLVVTGYEGLQFFRNCGDGTFVDWTDEAGLTDELWSSSAGWGDFNGDGHLDLYVAHYVDWSWDNHPRCPKNVPGGFDVCAPSDFEPLPDVVYLNEGDGTFRPVRHEIGLRDDGKGLGVIIADFNLDTHVDIYVANDTTNNFFYLNDGRGHFSEAGLVSGAAVDGNGVANGSMGLAVIDLENDLRPDLWVTNYENETFALYQNSGQGNFLWATERAGVNALGTLFVGFGTTAGDFDLDGDEDLVVANGHVMLFPERATVAQEPLLLVNSTRGMPGTRPGRLLRQTFPEGNYFMRPWRGRGVIQGDLDGDGKLDLVFTNMNEPAAILSNASETSGEALAVQLVGTRSNRDAIGAYAILETDHGQYARLVVGGGSYLSQAPYTLNWAIPKGEQFKRLTIRWPDGKEQRVDELPNGSPALIRQPVSVASETAGSQPADTRPASGQRIAGVSAKGIR